MECIAPCTMDACAMAADRAARNAVAGPRTTEYVPCIEGKRKIVRTKRIATKVSSYRVRLRIVGESTARRLALPIAIATPLPRLTDAGRAEIEPALGKKRGPFQASQ